MINQIPKKSLKLSKTQLRKLEQKAYERDGFMCQVRKHDSRHCSFGKMYLVGHHIIPKGRLRLDIYENLLTVCTCHIPLHSGCLSVSVDDLIDYYGLRGRW